MRISDWSSDLCSSDLVAFRCNIIPILRKDSRHLTDHDRELIRDTIGAQAARHVLVTHGSDSMVATAKVLSGIANKTIVLTGALNSARFRGSDAEFNIGTAVGAVQCLRSEEHTSELQSLMSTSYAVFCLKKTHTTNH